MTVNEEGIRAQGPGSLAAFPNDPFQACLWLKDESWRRLPTTIGMETALAGLGGNLGFRASSACRGLNTTLPQEGLVVVDQQ